MKTYVYGIARSSHPGLPVEHQGVGDPPQPVRAVQEGELLALVSDAPDDIRPKRRDLLAHQAVLAEAGAAGAVLPLRFGGLSPDDAAVKSVLAERADHFLERLRTLDGKVEFNVKAAHDEDAVLHQVLAENAELRAMSEANRAAGGGTYEQKVEFGERVVAVVKQYEARDADLLHRSLEGVAEATSPAPESTGWLANVSFLVPQDRAAEFANAVDELSKNNPHLSVRVNGPLPPYSFVE
ncbi:GvpL/GvpF family gas vesicle protein [Streptomyces sp. NPDC002889]|uniref:GvpL/GvpF family gas vesicle protein n=1 Tax=Streptomyces sp. NPDC002889 TaxID=3364669 RepID=UPI003693C43D